MTLSEALEDLVRQRDALNAAIEAIQEQLDAAPARVPSRCPICKGTGYLVENGGYCSCQMGRDLRQVEKGRIALDVLPGEG
jgi:hypothetical protein